jgi:hypothetical protein
MCFEENKKYNNKPTKRNAVQKRKENKRNCEKSATVSNEERQIDKMR